MSAAREIDQADFDLERFIDMFDEAMTSSDPRVVETLRRLMMIVALTAPETRKEHSRHSGPLRRLFEDMNHLNGRMHRMQDEIERLAREPRREEQRAYQWSDKYSQVAVKQMAQSIDQDAINQLKMNASNGLIKGLTKK